MASYGYTFSAGDTVTPTRLNSARTVSDIVNADIKSDAAIAGTKIAPDFGSQNVVTTGGAVVGHTQSVFGGKMEVFAGGSGAFVSVMRHTNDASGPAFAVVKTRGTTADSKTIVQSGDTLGSILWQGTDGSSNAGAASISAQVDGTPGANDMPGRLIFSTTADGANSVTERMRIDSGGRVGIGTNSPTQLLQVGNGTASTISYILGDLNGYGAGLQIHNDNTGSSAAAYIDFGLGADTTAASIHARKQSDGSADLALLASNTAGTTVDAIVIDGSTNNTGIGTATPNASAVLDVASTTKGFLPPRMTTAQRDAISTPPAGLVIYNTSTNVLNFYNGSAWGAV